MRIQTWSEETEEVVGAGAGDQGSLGLSETRERERGNLESCWALKEILCEGFRSLSKEKLEPAVIF